jgi:3-oxoacyl-[acyl-carrier protein] reductase
VSDVRFEVLGHVALVTGAGSGIGRAIAVALAAVGVAVGIADKDAARVASATEAAQRGGARVHGSVADVARADDIRRVVSEVSDRLGRIDILVNSAGIFPRSSVLEMSEEEWDLTSDTNLKSCFLASQAVLPAMIARKWGRIISITSGLGMTGVARGAHYAASKAGIDALTRSLAKEVMNDGINVNAIAPGLTDTPMMRGANTPEYIASVTKTMPGGKLGEPEDVVGLALFLVSEGARHITGQVIGLRG